jgi:hypothetical protein
MRLARSIDYLDVDAWLETFVGALEAGVLGWNEVYETTPRRLK